MINQFIVSEYLHDAVQRLEELGDVGGGEEDADLVDEVPLSGSKHGPSYGSLNLFWRQNNVEAMNLVKNMVLGYNTFTYKIEGLLTECFFGWFHKVDLDQIGLFFDDFISNCVWNGPGIKDLKIHSKGEENALKSFLF